MTTMTTLTKNLPQGGEAAVGGVVMVVAMMMFVMLVAVMMVAVGMLVSGVALMLVVAVMAVVVLLVTVLVVTAAVCSTRDTQPLHLPLPGLRTGSPSVALTFSPLPLSVPPANPCHGPCAGCPHKDLVTVCYKTVSLSEPACLDASPEHMPATSACCIHAQAAARNLPQ